jgi:hypothetical protein
MGPSAFVDSANNLPVEEAIRLLGLANRFEMAGKEL